MSKTFGKYELLRQLNWGTGTVYLAKESLLNREVALRIFDSRSASDPEAHARFVRLAQVAAGLHHPNIVVIYEFGEQDGISFLAMEGLSGENLRHCIDRRIRLTIAQKLQVGLQVARALEYAHRQGVTHRDVTPDSVLLLPSGEVKLMDFGLAETLAEPGTIGYASPEQLQDLPVTAATDVFSFGVLMYELLCGRKPFVGADAAEVLLRTISGSPAPFDVVGAAVPPPLQLLIYRCLAKRPEERFESFTAIVAELRHLFHAALKDTGNRGTSGSHPAEPAPTAATSAESHLRPELVTAARSSHNGGMADTSSHRAEAVGAIYSPSDRQEEHRPAEPGEVTGPTQEPLRREGWGSLAAMLVLGALGFAVAPFVVTGALRLWPEPPDDSATRKLQPVTTFTAPTARSASPVANSPSNPAEARAVDATKAPATEEQPAPTSLVADGVPAAPGKTEPTTQQPVPEAGGSSTDGSLARVDPAELDARAESENGSGAPVTEARPAPVGVLRVDDPQPASGEAGAPTANPAAGISDPVVPEAARPALQGATSGPADPPGSAETTASSPVVSVVPAALGPASAVTPAAPLPPTLAAAAPDQPIVAVAEPQRPTPPVDPAESKPASAPPPRAPATAASTRTSPTKTRTPRARPTPESEAPSARLVSHPSPMVPILEPSPVPTLPAPTVPAAAGASGAESQPGSAPAAREVASPAPPVDPSAAPPSEPTQVVPTPAPAASPEVPLNDGAEEKDLRQIRELMERYRLSSENLDATALQEIRPSLKGKRLRTMEEAFDSYSSQKLRIEIRRIAIAGNTASVHATLRRTIRPKEGEPVTDERAIKISVRRSGGSWVIDD